MKPSDLTSQERATYRRFIHQQLEKGTALAALRLMLEKQGVDAELARELIKTTALKHARDNINKAYLSLGTGSVIALGLIFYGSFISSSFTSDLVGYAIGSFAVSIFGFMNFYKRYRYLKNLN